MKKLLKRTVASFGRDLFNVWCDPVQALRLDALDDTVAYIKANAADALCLANRDKLMDLALSRITPTGLVLEFGVYRGKSINRIASRLAPRRIYGFDSFRGNPEDWAGWNAPRGVFNRGGERPKVAPNVTLVDGYFEDSLPGWCRSATEQDVAFVHIDCDLYSSTRTVFEHIGPWLREGSVIVFDEYFNYVNWRAHEHRAFRELVAARALRYRYLAFSTQQVAVEIL